MIKWYKNLTEYEKSSLAWLTLGFISAFLVVLSAIGFIALEVIAIWTNNPHMSDKLALTGFLCLPSCLLFTTFAAIAFGNAD